MPNLPLPSSKPDEWLTRRLINVAESDPRFEASWYGPYNALLSHYFPYQQHFLVKPQPKVRGVQPESTGDISFSSVQANSSGIFEPPEELEFLADLSMTSMGNLAVEGGTIIVPDFIVTKSTEFASHDRPVLLVEVKPQSEGDMKTHAYQMDQYMDRIAEHIPKGASVIGLLVCGTEVCISRLDGPENEVRVDEVIHKINSKTIRELLLGIARDNWAY